MIAEADAKACAAALTAAPDKLLLRNVAALGY